MRENTFITIELTPEQVEDLQKNEVDQLSPDTLTGVCYEIKAVLKKKEN